MQINDSMSVINKIREKTGHLFTLASWWPAALLLLAFIAMPAHAQFRTSVQGVVTDPEGALIPGATLTLTNQATDRKSVV